MIFPFFSRLDFPLHTPIVFLHNFHISAHTVSERMVQHMKNETRNNTASENPNLPDSGNIPPEDVPQEVIPDEVPRKDGPGGE